MNVLFLPWEPCLGIGRTLICQQIPEGIFSDFQFGRTSLVIFEQAYLKHETAKSYQRGAAGSDEKVGLVLKMKN